MLLEILITIFVWDVVLGSSMLAYLYLNWKSWQEPIVKNGWTLECCSPFYPYKQIAFLYIPVIGFVWYIFVGTMLDELAHVKKTPDASITFSFLGITATYFE